MGQLRPNQVVPDIPSFSRERFASAAGAPAKRSRSNRFVQQIEAFAHERKSRRYE
jgi:hypothetical protein